VFAAIVDRLTFGGDIIGTGTDCHRLGPAPNSSRGSRPPVDPALAASHHGGGPLPRSPSIVNI